MKKSLFTALFMACLVISYSQVVDPKVLKNTGKIPLLNQPVLLLDQLNNNVFYIESNGFMNVNTQTHTVPTDRCATAVDLFQWKFLKNSDGTYSILSLSNNTPKLVYQRSTIVLPRNTGISGGASQNNGYVVQYSTDRASASFAITDKFWVNPVHGQDYWLVHADRRDSILIRLFKLSDINAVSFNFSSMTGWVAEGSTTNNAFAGQPSSTNFIPFFDSPVLPAMPLGGSYWVDLEHSFFSVNTKAGLKYINTSRPGDNHYIRPDETKTGVLTCLPFVMCGEKITFRIAGTQDAANIKFEFLQRVLDREPGVLSLADGLYKVVSSTNGHNNDVTRNIVINAADQKDKVCRFRITDNSATGHILVDDINISFTGQIGSDPIPPTPEIMAMKPIWGAIDMHTHPMSYMGMGGKLMFGPLDGDPNQVLANCNYMHGGWGTDNPTGNYLTAEVVNMVDEHYADAERLKVQDLKVPHKDHPHEGYPHFKKWPVQTSMTHQQMWWDWMKRAKEGGLTSIIALAINSEVLGRALGGNAPFDDKAVADRQIDALIAFVHRHNDFLDTVTSSARMRQVVMQGKMAVIIGMEVDDLGNFYQNMPASNEQIKNEIIRLKNKGVRYVFPIHVTDNKFGGTAVYKELFNYNNKYVTSQPITGTVPVAAYPPVLPGNLYNVELSADRNVSFRLAGDTMFALTMMRPLVEVIEAGGLPIIPLPPPADVQLLVAKALVDPVIIALKNSEQYQLAKKIFLDMNNVQLATYDRIKRSDADKGGHSNVLGMSSQGLFAVTEMMRQGLMIDVDHASEKSVNDMIALARANHNYPLNSGHNGLRGTSDNEKTRTVAQLAAIKDLGGMFGMGWEGQNPVTFNSNFRRHWGAMGSRSTAFGSDIDGYATTPEKPVSASQFINYTISGRTDFLKQYHMDGSDRVWDYNTGGMAHIGMIPDFFEALKKAGASSAQINGLLLSSEYFAQMWEKCETTAPMIAR